MRKLCLGSLAAGGLLALATTATASITLVNNSTVFDDFDAMINTGFTALSATTGAQLALAGSGGSGNVGTFDGAKIGGTGTNPMNLTADNGTANSGALYSYGPAAGTPADTERALGALASGTNIAAFGVELINNTGAALTSIMFDFYREQWRSSTSSTATPNTIACATGLSGGTATSANYLTDISLLPFTAMDLVGEAPVVANGALDGNDALHRVHITATLTVLVPAGSRLFVRWSDVNDQGNDAGLAIDEMHITPVPEPATIGLLVLGALTLVRRRA